MAKTDFVTDFFFISVHLDTREGKDSLIIYSGVNLDRFMSITSGRYGIGGNPILSGLRLVKYDMCALAISKGATAKDNIGNLYGGMPPTKEAWYTETLLIENPGGLTPDDLIRYGVEKLVQKITSCARPGHQAPRTLHTPDEFQAYLAMLCNTNLAKAA